MLKLLSPKYFYNFSGKLLPWLVAFTVIFLGYGLIGGLLFAPADYQQGDVFRIMYIHVPCAFLSLLIYACMAVGALIALVWRITLMDRLVSESATLGAVFTALALVTGSVWGKPTWGSWWVWDARLTSELILFFLYCGYIALRAAIPEKNKAFQASSILLIVGSVNLPIIHYSVYWWNTLHQGATLSLMGPSKIAGSMEYPLLSMMAGLFFYAMIIVLVRVRALILCATRM